MSIDLELAVDRASEVPVGTQLAWKLRTLIATAALAPGARLPGIRELAELAGVNINTVRTVLARLEEQGLLVTQQGRGNFIADTAQSHASLARTADAVISQAQAAGIDPRELAAALYVTSPVQPAATAPSAADERTERRSLRAQIERLERELAEIEPLSGLTAPPADAQPRLLSASELRQVRDTLVARIHRLEQERRRWRAEQERRRAEEEQEEAAPRARSRHWGAGVWTGGAGAEVSWTTA
jgi:DNA-binding transcriptional regulator YhcF (GntR family)